MTARKPSAKATVPAVAKAEQIAWDEPALLPTIVRNDHREDDLLGECPAWCVEVHHEEADVRKTPSHFSTVLLARSSKHPGYYADSGNSQTYGHLWLRLRQRCTDGAPEVMIEQVWGGDNGERVQKHGWQVTIPEARNLIIALQHLVTLGVHE